jgi:hypothetical protein
VWDGLSLGCHWAVTVPSSRSRRRPVRPADSAIPALGPMTGADARFEHRQRESGRAGSGVCVAMVGIAVEGDRITDLKGDLLIGNGDLQGALEHLRKFSGAGCVRFTDIAVAGRQRPVPQLGDVWRLGTGDQHTTATRRARPQRRALPGPDHPHRHGRRRLDQRRQTHSERVPEPQQRAHAGVGGTLLDMDEHPSADSGRCGELVQGPAPNLSFLLDPGADRQRQRCRTVIHWCSILHF